MPTTLVAEQEIKVGEPAVIEGPSPGSHYSVYFEDDGDTGYFYALDHSPTEPPIRDAVHIYNSASVSDKDIPSNVQIVWSPDSMKAELLINGYPHAAFDFFSRCGYCRMGGPLPLQKSQWTRRGEDWDAEVNELFVEG